MRVIDTLDWDCARDAFTAWAETHCEHYGGMIEAILVDPVIASLENHTFTMLWHGRIIDEPQEMEAG